MSLRDVINRIKIQSADKPKSLSEIGQDAAKNAGLSVVKSQSDLQAPAVAKPYDIKQEIVGTVARVPYQAAAQISDMAGFVTGSKAFPEISKILQERSRRDFPSNAPQITSMADLSNASLVDLAKYGLAESGQVVSSLASMAIPGAAANTMLLPMIGRVAAASPKVAKFVNFLGGAEKAAAYASSFVSGTSLEAGAISTEKYNATGEMPERLKNLPWAMAAGALESITPMRLAARYLAKLPADVAQDAAKLSGKTLINHIVNYAKDMGLEGGTEFLQTLIEEAAVKNLSGMSVAESIYSTATDPDAIARGFAAGISGFAGGGVAGGPGFVSDVARSRSVPAEPTVVKKENIINLDVDEDIPTQQAEMSEAKPDDLNERISILRKKMDESRELVDQPDVLREANSLAQKMKEVRSIVNNTSNVADVGGITPTNEAAISKEAKRLLSVLEGIGVTGDMIEDFSMQVMKKPFASLNNDEVRALTDFAIDQAAQGNEVAPAMNLPETLRGQMPQPQMNVPQMQPQAPAPAMTLADRISNVQAMAAQRASQPMQMQQPARMEMPIRQPEMKQETTERPQQPEPVQIPAEKWAVYPVTVNSKEGPVKRFAIRQNMESDKGFGDSLFQTEEEAKAESKKMQELEIKNEEFRQKEAKAAKEKADAEAARVAKRKESSPVVVDEEYMASLEPRERGRIEKILNEKVSWAGKTVSRIDVIESGKYVKKEIISKNDEDKYYLVTSDQSYLKVPKIIYDAIRVKSMPENVQGEPNDDFLEAQARRLRSYNVEQVEAELASVEKQLSKDDLIDEARINLEAKKNLIEKIISEKRQLFNKQPETEKQPDVTKKAYGEDNTIVTTARYEELKKRFKEKTKNITSGIDPELATITVEMAAYHLEAGVRKFSDFAKKVLDDLGEEFRPYLASSYMGAKFLPGSEKYRAEMDSEATVEAAMKFEFAVVEPGQAVETKQPKPETEKPKKQKAKKPVLSENFKSNTYDINISMNDDGLITATYSKDNMDDSFKYFNDRGNFAPNKEHAWLVPAGKREEAFSLAVQKEKAEYESNSSEHYRKVIAPIQGKIISLFNKQDAHISEALLPFAKTLLTEKADNKKLDAAVKESGLSLDRKQAQEALEGAITLLIREKNLYGNFEKLETIYRNMPNLNERTGGSMTRQAYSTPHILASLITDAAGLPSKKLTIYEPTAGNGLLLSGVVENEAGNKNTYFLNELDKDRNEMLKKLFPDAKTTNEDATKTAGPDIKVDFVAANPPFGAIEKTIVSPMKAVSNAVRYISFTKLEHVIAWKALENLRDDGKAIIILGAEKENKITGARSTFARAMYNQFNIAGHFELDGQLYRKMGAEWPVEVYIVDGIREFQAGKNLLKAPESVRRISNEEGWIGVKNYLDENVKPGQYINRAIEPDSGKRPGSESGKLAGDDGIAIGERSGKSTTQKTESLTDSKAVPAEPAVEPEQRPVADSEGDTGTRRSNERVERVKRVLANESTERQEQRRPATTPEPDKPGNNDTRINSEELGVADSLQAPYRPAATGFNFKSLVPKNLEKPTRDALSAILEKTGENSVNDYVAKQLGYDDGGDIPFLAGEQIDALAETFYSLNQNGGNIIADQTGVGKGRIAAATIQWAVQNGKIPVFFTEKEGLFNDIYRDLRAIGQGALRPFMFNDKAEMAYENEDGDLVPAYKQDPKIFDEVFERMVNGDFSDFTGPNRKFDFIALTYSQVNKTPESFNGKGKLKIQAFERAKNLIPILDESHTAAGQAGDTTGQKKDGRRKDSSNQMENVLKIIEPQKSSGVVYLSATWAKTPENVPVYYRAFEQKNLTMDEIQTAFKRGDLAIQEMVVQSMANKGRYIRREQSYAGVKWSQNQTEEKTRQAVEERRLADVAMEQVRNVISLDAEISGAMGALDIDEIVETFGIKVPDEYRGGDSGSGSRFASSLDNPGSPFSGVHNYINAFLASVKADRAADRAIELIKAGQKPVISIQNTMESHMDALLAGDKKIGDAFGGTYGDILKANIDKLRKVSIQHPFDKKKPVFSFLLPEEALPMELIVKINEIKKLIDRADMAKLPFSPIDYVMAKIKKAGYSVGEITGRGKYLDYTDMVDGKPTMKARSAFETSAKGKKQVLAQFNSGALDAMILNSSGATGLSAHSSRDFKDQRQRVMLILQPFDDINTFTQMLGRIHRNGAAYDEKDITSRIDGKPAKYGWPEYEYMQSSLGMEERPAARLQAKMKSLNANTSSSKEGRQKISDVDVLNKYGSEVIQGWLRANRDYAAMLGYLEDDDIKASTSNQVTGRIAILPQQIQNSFWNEVITNYTDYIDQLNSLGANDLIVPTYDKADAVTIKRQLVYGEEGNPDSPPVYSEFIEMTAAGNPTTLEVAQNRAKVGSYPTEAEIENHDEAFKAFIAFKRQEREEFKEKTGRESSIRIDSIENRAKEIKELLGQFKVGTAVSGSLFKEATDTTPAAREDYVGIVTDVKLSKIPEGFIGNPWLAGNIKVSISCPSSTGQLILPIYRLESWRERTQDQRFIFEWNRDFQKNSTKRIVKQALTGDMLKSSTMSGDSEVVQMQRREGTTEYMWLAKQSEMRIQKPVEKLTFEQMKNPPAIITSMDADRDVVIADFKPEERGDPRKNWIPLQQNATDYEIRIRYTSPYMRAIISDQKLAEILDPVGKDPFVKEKLTRGANFMVTKKTVPKAELFKALQRLAEILEAKTGGLTDGSSLNRNIQIEVPTTRGQITQMGSARSGRAGVLEILTEWADRKASELLESAYNFVVRGSGSYLQWLKTVAEKFRALAAKAWKDARRLLEITGREGAGLGRRGAIISYRELVRNANVSIDMATDGGKKELSAGAAKEIVDVVSEAAYEEGKKTGQEAAKKTAAFRKRQADERVAKKQEMIDSLRARKELDYQGRKFLVELASKLPLKDRGALIKQITNATTPKRVGAVINKIDDLFQKNLRREAMKRFKESLRAARKLRPEFQELADEVRKDPGNQWLAYESLDGILRFINDDETIFIPSESKAALEALRENKPKALNYATVNLISDVLDSIVFLNNLKNKQIFGENTKTMYQAASDIKEHLPTEDTLANEEGETKKWFLNVGSMQFEAITEMMGETGKKVFYDDLRNGEREMKRIWFEGRDAAQKTMDKLGKRHDDYKTKEWFDEKSVVAKQEMTRNERMNLAANLLDSDTKKEILRTGFKLKPTAAQTIMITEEQAKQVIDSLSEEERQIIEAMRGYLNGNLKDYINKAWVDLAGFEKATRKDYWPRVRDINKVGLNQGYKQWAKTALEELGIFKERTRSKQPVVIGNVTEVYNNHLKKSAALAGLGVPVRNIEMLLGVGGIAKAVEIKFGRQFIKRIEEQVSAVADLGNPTGGELDRRLSNFLQKISVGYLGFNLRSSLKQFGGLFTAATEINGSLLVENLKYMFDKQTEKEMFKYSPILRDRYDSTGAKLVTPMFDTDSGTGGMTKIEIWKRRAMWLLETFDKAVSQIIWQAAKSEIKAANPKMPNDELLKAVASRAEQVISRTQNVTSVLDMSGIAVESRKQAGYKALTMFQSQGNSIYNIIRRAIRNYRRGDISGAKLLGILTLATTGNAVWSSMVGNLVTASLLRGGGDDDKEEKKIISASETAWDVVQENLNMFYGGSLVSPFVRQIKRIADKDKVFVGETKIENATESAINNSMHGLIHILSGALKTGEVFKSGPSKGKQKSEAEYKRGAIKLFRGLAPATGFPMFPVSEAMKLL